MPYDLYAVVEHNQASGRPSGLSVGFYDNKDDAFTEARESTAENWAAGRRETYRVYLLEPVEEDAT